MIEKQTTTLIFEYPQDYLQEQEWRKTKGDRWVHKSKDTLGSVYENTLSYSIGAPAGSKTEPGRVASFENAPETKRCSKDLISRQAAIEAMKDMYKAAEKWGREASDEIIKARAESCMASLLEIKLRVDKIPAAEPEIIRCNDCKYGVDYYHEGDCYCSNPKWGLKYFCGSWKFYCADAERRTSAKPEPSIARDIATIIENEKDMRVILRNAEPGRKWNQLRDTISEMAENGGDGTQEDVCRYLLRYMDVIEEENNEREGCESVL